MGRTVEWALHIIEGQHMSRIGVLFNVASEMRAIRDQHDHRSTEFQQVGQVKFARWPQQARFYWLHLEPGGNKLGGTLTIISGVRIHEYCHARSTEHFPNQVPGLPGLFLTIRGKV